MGVRVPPFANIHKTERPMDCSAFCTASSYKIKLLFQSLKSRYNSTLFRDVIHIEAYSEGSDKRIEIFYFPYGAVVCWGVNLAEGSRFLKEATDFQEQPLKEVEVDDFTFSYGEELKIFEDDITLPNDNLMTKLAISHGIAQSVRLGTFENTLSQAFEKTKRIPEDLAKQGKITLSRKEVRKKMGELFIDRSSINLHVDVLDTPEFFWEHPELQPYYTYTANELEVEKRGNTLNQRLDVLKELFEMLSNEVNSQHTIRLEWIIILLILMEVVITILTHYKLI
jgi:uncharacterized Rmd1/YagE family protein